MAGKATSLLNVSAMITNAIDAVTGMASRAEGVNDSDVQQVALVYGVGGLMLGTHLTAKKAEQFGVRKEDVTTWGVFPKF